MFRFATALLLVSLILTSPTAAVNATPSATPSGGLVGNGTAGSCTQATLHAALAGGGLVTFNCGGAKTITLASPEAITLNTILDGGGLITLDGQEATRLFTVSAAASLTLRHIVLLGARSTGSDGGAIVNDGALTLDDTTIANSATDNNHSGGAIFSDGPVTITNSLLKDNFGGSAGALFANFAAAQVLISNSEFQGNHADNVVTGFGGAIWMGEQAGLTLMGGSLHNNQAQRGGGLYLSPGAAVTITNPAGGTTFSANRAFASGGAIYNQSGGLAITGAVLQANSVPTDTVSDGHGGAIYSDGALALDSTVMQQNLAQAGGGLYAQGAVTLVDTQFLSNTGQALGGGADISGDPAIAGGVFENNLCVNNGSCGGGGLYVTGSPTLTGTQFISNTSLGSGGALRAAGSVTMTGGLFEDNLCDSIDCTAGGLGSEATIWLSGTQFIRNSSQFAGGGAFADVGITAQGGWFQDNQCKQELCEGGGLESENLSLTGTQIIGNLANGNGGGAYASSAAQLVNALFARNSATGAGAALFLAGPGNSTVLYTTIAGPGSAGSTAIGISAGDVGISDTIITSYTVGISLTAGSAYEDHNLFFAVPAHTAGGVTSGGHSFNGNPVFASAAHDDYHLWFNSAAIDAGVDVGVTEDVDGDHRPLGAGFDIGFDEFNLRRLFLALLRR